MRKGRCSNSHTPCNLMNSQPAVRSSGRSSADHAKRGTDDPPEGAHARKRRPATQEHDCMWKVSENTSKKQRSEPVIMIDEQRVHDNKTDADAVDEHGILDAATQEVVTPQPGQRCQMSTMKPVRHARDHLTLQLCQHCHFQRSEYYIQEKLYCFVCAGEMLTKMHPFSRVDERRKWYRIPASKLMWYRKTVLNCNTDQQSHTLKKFPDPRFRN